ncbi:MAG: ADP-heptose--LPS heptosyltransferase [Ignavibacteria bacterium RBG_16_34_14]|nr:MAG: ADP-heptose--LPS heptosyltransferase [Ignavibacteria bacterium RBG_16_34_14]
MEPQNLLIVRTDRIGDVILSLPLAGIVKKHFPDCKVTFLVRDYTRELVENHPYIDNILTLKEENGRVSIKNNIAEIKKYNFDSSIIVYPTFATSLIIFLSGIKNRIGTGYRWYSILFNEKVYEHRKYAERHELEFNVNLLRKFNIDERVNPANVRFNIYINPESDKKIKRELKENSIDPVKPIIIFHPGSLGSSIDLPIEKFKELIHLVNDKTGFQIIITGSRNERELCEKLVLNNRINNLAGKFSLSEMISLINLSGIFVSNSTGPIHIAAALNKYTIGFYPKILACSAKRWGPYTQKAIVFIPEIDCENCDREQCNDLSCMSSINVMNVFAEIEKIYKLITNNGEIK